MAAIDTTIPLNDYLISCRRALHQIPELHFALPKTTAFVADQLGALSIHYETIENGGVVATVGGCRPGKTFLLRADMDALPLLEQSGEPFSSTNGWMHACGHDLHTAMLLGAARELKAREHTLSGTIKLVFQNNEEGIAGMEVLIQHGLMENPHVDAALALHVFPGRQMEAGTYSSLPGPANSSVDEYRIEIYGKGAHGAMPYRGIDPINVGIHIYMALLAMMTKEIDARETAVLSNGYFLGGTQLSYNVIPATAVMGGGIRTLNNELAAYIKGRLKEIAETTAATFQADCAVTFPAAAPACVNHPEICALVDLCAAELGMINLKRPPQLSSDDFSHVAAMVPSGYVWVGAGGAEPEYADGVLHDPRVRFNEKALMYGTQLLVNVATRWLETHA